MKTALLTVVVTPISAAVGLIETAPCDQFDVLLKTSETGTLGAPARVLPVPVTSRALLPPVLRFHCEACGLSGATPTAPPVARVSITMPLTTLDTSTCELHADVGFALATQAPAVPSAETKAPSG